MGGGWEGLLALGRRGEVSEASGGEVEEVSKSGQWTLSPRETAGSWTVVRAGACRESQNGALQGESQCPSPPPWPPAPEPPLPVP